MVNQWLLNDGSSNGATHFYPFLVKCWVGTRYPQLRKILECRKPLRLGGSKAVISGNAHILFDRVCFDKRRKCGTSLLKKVQENTIFKRWIFQHKTHGKFPEDVPKLHKITRNIYHGFFRHATFVDFSGPAVRASFRVRPKYCGRWSQPGVFVVVDELGTALPT